MSYNYQLKMNYIIIYFLSFTIVHLNFLQLHLIVLCFLLNFHVIYIKFVNSLITYNIDLNNINQEQFFLLRFLLVNYKDIL